MATNGAPQSTKNPQESKYTKGFDLWTLLPAELQREIVELVAYQSRKAAATLCRTSVTFNAWTTPILYRVLHFGSSKMVPWFLNDTPRFAEHKASACIGYVPTSLGPMNATPEELDIAKLSKYGPFVKSLMIHDQDHSLAIELLKLCKNVRNLALWLTSGDNSLLWKALNDLPQLERLSMSPDNTLEGGLSESGLYFQQHYTFIRNLTHLELVHCSFTQILDWKAAQDLCASRMPHLTHLALHVVPTETFLPSIVEGCPQLRVVVIFGGFSAIPGAQRTEKVVFMYKGRELLGEWELSALDGVGGPWERADVALQQNTHRDPRR